MVLYITLRSAGFALISSRGACTGFYRLGLELGRKVCKDERGVAELDAQSSFLRISVRRAITSPLLAN